MSDSTKTGAWANLEESVGEISILVPPTVLGATALNIAGVARYAGIVSEVAYYPNAGIVGADTDTRRLRVYNRGTAGAGTKVVADTQYNLATDLLAKAKNVLTLTAVLADKTVAVGDVFEFNSAFVGTGIADPGGKLVIKITRS